LLCKGMLMWVDAVVDLLLCFVWETRCPEYRRRNLFFPFFSPPSPHACNVEGLRVGAQVSGGGHLCFNIACMGGGGPLILGKNIFCLQLERVKLNSKRERAKGAGAAVHVRARAHSSARASACSRVCTYGRTQVCVCVSVCVVCITRGSLQVRAGCPSSF
jgi:hypothetical protein